MKKADNKKSNFKFYVSTRKKEIHEMLKALLTKDFGCVSTGIYTLLMVYAHSSKIGNLVYYEELKRDNLLLSMNKEEINKVYKQMKIITRRANELEIENKALKKQLKEKKINE
jgi:hypothetical protein